MTVLDEITELDELALSKVSAVDRPANGSPWLLVKAAARVSAEADDDQKECELCAGKGKILQGHRKCPDCKGSGTVAKSSSAEADSFQLESTGESVDAQDVITSLEDLMAVTTDPAQIETIGATLTLKRLAADARRIGGPPAQIIRKGTPDVSENKLIKKLEKSFTKLANDDPRKAQAGEALTRYRLTKANEILFGSPGVPAAGVQTPREGVQLAVGPSNGFPPNAQIAGAGASQAAIAANASAQASALQAAVLGAQQSATRPAIASGQSTGANRARDLIATLAAGQPGAPASLSGSADAGAVAFQTTNSGGVVKEIKRLQKALRKTNDPVLRDQLSRDLTYATLYASHGGR